MADCARRLERYRSALESGADPTVVAAWIGTAQGEKLAAQRVLAESTPPRATVAEIRNLLHGLGDITTVLEQADPAMKAKVYRETLAVRLVYLPEQANVLVTAAPAGHVPEAVSEGRRSSLTTGVCDPGSSDTDRSQLRSLSGILCTTCTAGRGPFRSFARGTREAEAMASSEKWASGRWLVRAGSEDDFVKRWKAWLSWTTENAPGFRSAMLIRSEDDGRRFESFSDWDDAQSRAQWEASDGFRERMGPVRELCEDVQAGNFELAASFSSS